MKNSIINKITILALLVMALTSCKAKVDNNDLKKDVLALHDSIMAADGEAMGNKMAIDSLIAAAKIPAVTAQPLSDSLSMLSDRMMNWMHQFDPEQGKRTDEQMSAYFTDQQKQLRKLDKSYKELLSSSRKIISDHHVAVRPMKGMKM